MTVKEPSLKKNFSWTLLGNVTYAASLWGVLVILTKLGSPETVGRFSLASAIATPVLLFANFQLRGIFVTDAKETHQFSDYFGVRMAAIPVALLIIVVIALAGYSREQALAISLFAFARSFEGLSDIYYGLFQKNERMDLVARSTLIKGPSALILFGLVFALTRDLQISLVGLIAAWALPLLLFDIPQARRVAKGSGLKSIRPRWSLSVMRRIVWLALPMGLVMLLMRLRNTIPRTVLESQFSEAELGIFSALAYVVIAGGTIALALSQASVARLSRYYTADDGPRFRSTVWKLVFLGGSLCVGGVIMAALFGKFILTVLYTPEFAEHSDLFVVIMAGGGLLYVGNLLGAPATAMRAFRTQFVIMLVNTVLMLGLAFWWIPAHGMMGAAWTMLASAVYVTLAYAALIWYRQRTLGDGS